MQRFVSSNGFVEISNGSLFVKTTNLHFWNTAVGEYLYALVLPLILAVQLVFWDERTKGDLVFFTILTLLHINQITNVLFKKSFATRIPLHRIKSWEAKELQGNDLETNFVLHLQSGRRRHILFRKREDGLAGLEAVLKAEQPFNPRLGAAISNTAL